MTRRGVRGLAVVVAAAAVAVGAAAGTYGVDFAAPMNKSTAACMVSNGRTFGVVRAWRSYGVFDTNAPASVEALWAGGMSAVDVYMFPCIGQSAASQANGLVDALAAAKVKYGKVWVDVESNPSSGCGWNTATGCAFFTNLLTTLRARGVTVGTYASAYEWSITVGANCTAGATTPLWYPHYDNTANFNDFRAFGGWKTPAIKQYSGTGSLCGFSIDSNWHP